MEREEIFGKGDENSYLYCIHCERAYKYGNFKQIIDPLFEGEILQMCPYEGCDGDAVLDAKDWDSIRDYHPDYPEIPELGKVYPLN